MDNFLDLTLIPAPNEPTPVDLYRQQQRIRRLLLGELPIGLPFRVGSHSGSGLDFEASAGGLHLPEVLSLAGKVAPQLGAILLAWLHGRSGRKIKMRIGDVEVEASTAKEVKKLLEKAQTFKQANEPKRIHER